MATVLQELFRPSFEKIPGSSSRGPFCAFIGSTKLSPAQEFLISNFSQGEGGGEKLFEGKSGERCHYPGCRALLSASNRYIYCRPCLDRYSRDFTEKNPLFNLTHALEKLRRDRKPRKQARRKRA